MNPPDCCRPSGFTLLEIAVVVGVIGILAALALPAASALAARGKSAACLSNLRQLGVGLQLYLQDHDLRMPEMEAGRRDLAEDVPVIDVVLSPYVENASAFICPADPGIGRDSGTSYYWNVALNGQSVAALNFLLIEDSLSRIPVLSDKEGWHRYRDKRVNFLYADGHASKDLQLFAE